MLGPAARTDQRRLAAIAIVVFILTVSYCLILPAVGDFSTYKSKGLSWLPFGIGHSQANNGRLALPPTYQQILTDVHTSVETPWCKDRFSPNYLEDFRDHAIKYCGQGSRSHLTCFHGTLASQRRDSLCIAENALLDPQSMKFVASCGVRWPTQDESRAGIVAFDRLENFWYDTGPRLTFETFWAIDEQQILPETTQPDPAVPPQYTILVKREGDTNIWHNLMEIFSTVLTFDILHISRENSTFLAPSDSGKALFTQPEDFGNTQVLILDEHNHGPIYDLWSLFTDADPLRWRDIEADPSSAAAQSLSRPHRIIVPLPGASNPLWQNDWEERDCTDSVLLRAFVERILAHFGIAAGTSSARPAISVPVHDRPLHVLVIDRRGSRQILDLNSHVAALVAAYPSANITLIDLATLPLVEQIRLIRETDLLVGAHGAGLTHIMFKKPGVGGVVEIKPEGMDFIGFKNLAKMNGNQYWTTHAEVVPQELMEERRSSDDTGANPGALRKRDPWHFGNLRIEEQEFVRIVGTAIRALTGEG